MSGILSSRAGGAALAILVAGAPACLHAQTSTAVVQNTAPNTDADRLANEIRTLAANPRDLRALVSAGNLSTRLGDTAAALAFFARADAIQPGDARVLAGRGSVMVRMERPGEALRLFNEAERRGLSAEEFAADRGLAYDLLGAPQLAQRDYRAALVRGGDDETVRRLGLSLGISGNATEAMAVLDPLVRRQDRAAWRARAFVLAMSGDTAGAEKIATSMMPGNLGAALQPFFRRLPSLPAADRAFAVHFGELMPTANRLADARSAPPLPVIAPQPVQVAAAVAVPAAKGRRTAPAQRAERQQSRAQTSAPMPAPAPAPTLEPPRYAPQMVQAVSPEPTRPPSVARLAQPAPALPQPAPVRAAAAAPQRPVQLTTIPASSSAAAPVASSAPRSTVAAAPPRGAAPDPILAKIVAEITIPDSERAIDAMTSSAVLRTAPTRPQQLARIEAKPTPAKAEAKPAPVAKETKKAPPKPDPAKLEPSRIWVQVASGADETAMPRAWKKLVDQAPAAFKGKSGWWTPVRATNRLLAGPFKTSAEAQAFINALRKQDIAAFVFASEAGQKVTKLAGK